MEVEGYRMLWNYKEHLKVNYFETIYAEGFGLWCKCFLQEQFGENCRIKWRILHLQNGESCKQSPDWDDQSGNCRHNINFIYAM